MKLARLCLSMILTLVMGEPPGWAVPMTPGFEPLSIDLPEPESRDLDLEGAWSALLLAPHSEKLLDWLVDAWTEEERGMLTLLKEVESRATKSATDAAPWLILAQLRAEHEDPVLALIDLSKKMVELSPSTQHADFSRVFDELEYLADQKLRKAMLSDVPYVVNYLERAGFLDTGKTFSACPMSRFEARTFFATAIGGVLEAPELRREELVELLQARRPQLFGDVLVRVMVAGGSGTVARRSIMSERGWSRSMP